MVMFAHRELSDIRPVAETVTADLVRIIKACFKSRDEELHLSLCCAFHYQNHYPATVRRGEMPLTFVFPSPPCIILREGNESCFWKVVIMA